MRNLIPVSILFCAAVCLAQPQPDSARAAQEVKNTVERFINTRTAGSKDDFLVAVEEIRRLADAGQPFYRFLLALYATQDDACKLPAAKREAYLKEGRPLLRKAAAEDENSLAQYLCGLDLAFNMDDRDGARRYFESAALQGSALAQNTLGIFYLTGQGVKQDDKKAVSYFQQAALSGDANGEYNLAALYQQGRGVPKDPAFSLELYSRAAAKGHSNAMNNLGWLYQHGIGVKANPEQAAEWYRKAAASGNPDGEFNYGYAFLRGLGVKPDPKQASVWFWRAASQGQTEAEVHLGILYRDGIGESRREGGRGCAFLPGAALRTGERRRSGREESAPALPAVRREKIPARPSDLRHLLLSRKTFRERLRESREPLPGGGGKRP